MHRVRRRLLMPLTTARSTLLALLIAGVLAACARGGREAMLEDYLQRLGRSVSQRPVPSTFIGAAGLPKLYDDDWERDAPVIGLLDFMRLQDCALQRVVAERNNSLGRFAPPSRRLLNTVDFLRLAPACIAALSAAGETALAAQLAAAVQFKQTHLPRLLWQAMLGSTASREFWRQPATLGDYPTQTGAELIVALESLSRLASAWLAGDYRHGGEALESELRSIAGGDGGDLLYALGRLSDTLARGDQLLAATRAAGPLCYFGRSNQRGDILFNVVRRYFIGEVQRWAAALNQRYYALWPALHHLEELLAAGEPAGYRRWREQRDLAIEHFRLAPRRHVEALHPLLSQCGLAPQAAAACPDSAQALPCQLSIAEAMPSPRLE